MSLQTGAEIGRASQLIIDPRQLKIVAFYCKGPRLDVNPAILNVSDIREIGSIGLIVDSADVLMSPDDLVRLKEVLDFNFQLEGKTVVNESGHKLGQVTNYTLDGTMLYVMKIHVRPGGWRAWKVTELIIDRNQIIEVTDDEVVVSDARDKKKERVRVAAAPILDNPFRPQAESITTRHYEK